VKKEPLVLPRRKRPSAFAVLWRNATDWKKLHPNPRCRRYDVRMAKGWESKAVESQVEDSQTEDRGKRKGQLTPAQSDAHRRKEILLLCRTRVQRDLQASSNPRYTEQLNRALADIEAQLAELGNID
jgi:hypothetical protein